MNISVTSKKNEVKKLNILYCGDKNIEDGLIISVLSLLKNSKDELHIYVMTMDGSNLIFENDGKESLLAQDQIENNRKSEGTDAIGKKILPVTDETIKRLDTLLKEKNHESFIKKIDITDLFIKDMPQANMETRFTPFCMLRLYADEIAELPDKILYLDNDVICRKNIEELYNLDLEGKELAGVLDYYGSWFFRNNILKRDYLNSGVLLLNLKEIRKNGLFAKCRAMCKEKKMFMPDQSAINKLAKHKVIIDRKFNEQRKLKEDTVIQHFTTSFRFFPWVHTVSVKPWNIEGMHKILKIHEYDELLREYKLVANE